MSAVAAVWLSWRLRGATVDALQLRATQCARNGEVARARLCWAELRRRGEVIRW